ncbi:lantibiotic dehydratase [Nocardia sp. NPDC050175]|uniref:lantibiotic dehydratase n=1 Tax=Nocardia sp. NPDC050175 TaxID=3364317 RepID=UPI0037904EE4
MSDSIFRAWDVFLLRAPLAVGASGLPPKRNHLDVLRAAVADPKLRAAITLATPSLGKMLDRVERGETNGIKATQLRRAALAVLRYDIRMRTRPTPFGVLSGVAAGRFDSSAKLDLGSQHRTRTHVDMQWLLGVAQELQVIPELLSQLRVRTHPALLRRGERVVLDCPSPLGAPLGSETRAVVTMRNSPVVDVVLRAAVQTVPVTELIAATAAQFGVPEHRVAELLRTLVEQEFLLSDLRPPLDGGDPLRHLIGTLTAADCQVEPVARALRTLREIDDRRCSSDLMPFGLGTAGLTETIKIARDLYEYETPLHIDTALDIEAKLPNEVRVEIERAAELMWRMSANKLGLRALREYHKKFLERYGTDRLVGIHELLDPARGLGAPAGYSWPISDEATLDLSIARDTSRILLMHRLIGIALRDGVREVELTDVMLGELITDDSEATDVPNSCEIAFHVLAPSLDSLSAGDFRVVLAPSPGSHQAGATLARFADLLSPDVQEVISAEAAATPLHVTDAFRVDLSFMPRSGKAANLTHTAVHSGKRISVGLPEAADIEEIALADVAVGATTERMCAIHLPTGREIVPALNNMISPMTQAPNISRLLWEIGLEGQRLWEPWSWAGLADMPFVPRIRYGRFVLAPAVWRMDVLIGLPERDFVAAVGAWRREWRVPNRILVVQRDQRLLFDLTDPAHLELLWDELRKDPAIVAHEVPGEDTCYDGINGHAMEVVVPMSRRDTRPLRSAHGGYAETSRAPAGLGSDWLFLELYLPYSCQSDFIRSELPALVEKAREHGCDCWFFIRYTGPDGAHLRVRFHGAAQDLWGAGARALGERLDSWQQAGLIRTHRIGQYDAEVERYGGDAGMAAAERVFEADSHAAIRFLNLIEDRSCAYSLDTFAAVSVAALAYAFGPPDSDTGGDNRWGDDAAMAWLSMTGSRDDLPDAYRVDAQRWRSRIDPYDGWSVLRADQHGAAAIEALRSRDTAVRELRSALAGSRTRHRRLIGSLMHMTCNRLFGGDSDRERAVVAIARGAVQDNFNKRKHAR